MSGARMRAAGPKRTLSTVDWTASVWALTRASDGGHQRQGQEDGAAHVDHPFAQAARGSLDKFTSVRPGFVKGRGYDQCGPI